MTHPVPGRRFGGYIDPRYALLANTVTLPQADSGLGLMEELPRLPTLHDPTFGGASDRSMGR